MKKLSIFALLLSASIPMALNAAIVKKPVGNWTCEDFLALKESYQPTAVGYTIALNMNNKGHEKELIDSQGIERVTPIIIQECKKDKKQSFRERLAKEWIKIK